MRLSRLPILAVGALAARCALPAVSAGTFLPAGDLKRGDLHASVSVEVARVLAGPTDVDASARAVPPGAQQWTVSTWASSDASLRWQAFDRVAFEAQLKLVNPVSPFVPVPVGGAVGARVRLIGRGASATGFALELGGRVVGVGVRQRLTRTQDVRSQTDTWNYRAAGFELPLVGSYRVSPLVAVTASPFLRLYRIRAWHSVLASDDTVTTTLLPWTAVLTAGLGISVAMDLGPVQIAPGLAVEIGVRPGGDRRASLLFEPGLAVGTRF
ncbi:MAG: hypothetical protein NVS2B9_04240 [Myxococcales bacterium]